MNILGIDYGKSKVGIALGDTKSRLAEPLVVLNVEAPSSAVQKILKVSKASNVSKIVVGVSEGKMADEINKFAAELRKMTKIPLVLHDETLTTKNAQELSIKAGIRRGKRKKLEHAYAATLILQSYLEKD